MIFDFQVFCSTLIPVQYTHLLRFIYLTSSFQNVLEFLHQAHALPFHKLCSRSASFAPIVASSVPSQFRFSGIDCSHPHPNSLFVELTSNVLFASFPSPKNKIINWGWLAHQHDLFHFPSTAPRLIRNTLI